MSLGSQSAPQLSFLLALPEHNRTEERRTVCMAPGALAGDSGCSAGRLAGFPRAAARGSNSRLSSSRMEGLLFVGFFQHGSRKGQLGFVTSHFLPSVTVSALCVLKGCFTPSVWTWTLHITLANGTTEDISGRRYPWSYQQSASDLRRKGGGRGERQTKICMCDGK